MRDLIILMATNSECVIKIFSHIRSILHQNDTLIAFGSNVVLQRFLLQTASRHFNAA